MIDGHFLDQFGRSSGREEPVSLNETMALIALTTGSSMSANPDDLLTIVVPHDTPFPETRKRKEIQRMLKLS